MAAPIDQLRAFAQRVYLVLKGRYYDGITDEDGVEFVNQVIDWTNMYIDELTTEVDTEGQPVNWKFLRSIGLALATASEGVDTIEITATDVDDLITDENRYVQITVNGTVVSNWAVVSPDQIHSIAGSTTEDRVAKVGNNLRFNRLLKDTEAGGSITGDVTIVMKPLSTTNVSILNTVKPQLLLVLGVAKNATLPDIVQGELSPAYTQKYKNLIDNAMVKNGRTTRSDELSREDLGSVGGVY